MALVRPFKATRPSPELAKSIAALPYDVMDSTEAREIAKDNPYSFLHVDKAEIDLSPSIDLYDDSVYNKAKENLEKLVNEKSLISDTRPYFYIYRLTMGGKAQTGLVACTAVDEYLTGLIKEHELTRKEKEKDRIRHIEATNANTGPIFLTYRNNHEIDEIINEWASSNTPVYDFIADDGVSHTVWVIDNSSLIEKIASLFAGIGALYVADGHHRSAAAARVCEKKRAGNPCKDAEFNFFLSVIFPDNQLYIMDYNRVVKTLNNLTEDEFLEKIQVSFDVEKIGATPYKPDKFYTFGMYLGGTWYKLSAKNSIINENDIVASLDVSILQNNVLSPILGIGDVRTDKNIDFVGGIRGLEDLQSRVDSGEMKVAFSMFPTSLGQLFNLADCGKIMPPKSTWFEPKPRSGLFIHYLD